MAPLRQLAAHASGRASCVSRAGEGRAEFRKAAADPYGVIEVNTNNAAVKTSGIYSNPLGAINRSWNEAVMNASMESVLTGFGDPRIAKFFEP